MLLLQRDGSFWSEAVVMAANVFDEAVAVVRGFSYSQVHDT